MANINILIVEDDDTVRDLAETVFSSNKLHTFTVFTAENGKAAIPILQNSKIDVVLTDYCMPLMHGNELCKIIKDTYPDIKTVIMTGYSDLDGSTMEHVADKLIKKPFTPKEVVSMVTTLLLG